MSTAPAPGNVPPNPELFEAGPKPPEKEPRGCFFYGCMTLIVLTVLMLIIVGIGGYFAYRAYYRLMEQYTSPTPLELAKVEMSEDDRKALHERFDAFKKALDRGEDAEPLVLNGDELNVLVADATEMEDTVHFVIDGNKLMGEISLPMNKIGLPGMAGRYFNGKATFLASLHEGLLLVRADSAEVNGKPLSDEFMAALRNENLAKDVANKPESAQLLRKLESIDIKDGHVTITAKPRAERDGKVEKESPPATKEEPAEDTPRKETEKEKDEFERPK
jgi:hypothetical protein